MNEFLKNGVVLTVGTRPPRIVDRTPKQITTTPEASSSVWFENVALYVRVAASVNPAVTGAFVSKDGRHVGLVAPERTPELSRAGAELVASLLAALKPTLDHWIEGGFYPSTEQLPPDCVWVYKRER